jgi:hypothetical protein
MSQDADFACLLERFASDPVLVPVLARLVDDLQPVREAAKRGDVQQVRTLLDDLLARALLRSALGDEWEY